MPVVSEPWFELPIPMEWETNKDGHTTVTRVDKHRVNIRNMPSVFGMPTDILKAMNELDVHEAELEREANEEAMAQAKAGNR